MYSRLSRRSTWSASSTVAYVRHDRSQLRSHSWIAAAWSAVTLLPLLAWQVLHSVDPGYWFPEALACRHSGGAHGADDRSLVRELLGERPGASD